MSYLTWTLFSIFFALILFIWNWRRNKAKFWPNHGFTLARTESIFGIIYKGLVQHEVDAQLYNHVKTELKVPFVGFMEFTKPVLLVTDLDLAKKMFVKDFDIFAERRELNMKETDPMFSKMLVFMESEPWKELRSKMSPTFTTGKIRRMFEIFNTSSTKLVQHLQKESTKANAIGVSDFIDSFGRYAMDVTASSAFGVDAKTFSEEDPIFQRMGKKLQLEIGLKLMISVILMTAAPKVAKVLGLGFSDKNCEKFFTGVILSAIKHRETSGEKRDDFLQLMLEARNGQLKAVDEAELSPFEKEARLTSKTDKGHLDKVILTDDVVVAQSVLFILAGFDTTTTLLLFAIYELAINPEVQQELYDEIEKSLGNNQGKFTYDTINHMEYLDKVINETLRKYPPVVRLERRNVVDYKIRDTDFTIPKQVLVGIPTYSIHHDEEHFPNPDKFDPERFSPEVKNARHAYAFQPFGHGPRNCIGMRFALINAKMAIANIVHNFEVEPCTKTLIPMKFGKSSTLKPQSMFLKLKPRN